MKRLAALGLLALAMAAFPAPALAKDSRRDLEEVVTAGTAPEPGIELALGVLGVCAASWSGVC